MRAGRFTRSTLKSMNLHPHDPDYGLVDTETLLWLAHERKPESLAFELGLLRTAFAKRHTLEHGPESWRSIARTRVRIAKRIKREQRSVLLELLLRMGMEVPV